MGRPTGSKNKGNPELSEVRITVRLPRKLLNDLDNTAKKHLQNRSEAILEAIREYNRRG